MQEEGNEGRKTGGDNGYSKIMKKTNAILGGNETQVTEG